LNAEPVCTVSDAMWSLPPCVALGMDMLPVV
jgi:hypothetical protein